MLQNAVSMHKRAVFCFFVLLLLFFVTILRLLRLSSDQNLAQTAAVQNGKTVEIYLPRGTFYDTNGQKLTNQTYKAAAVFTPTPQGVFSAAELLEGAEKERVLADLQSGTPAVTFLEQPVNALGVTCISVPQRYSNPQVAAHTLGYINAQGQGVSGLERGMNDLLSAETALRVRFATDAKGNVLQGVEPTVLPGSKVCDVKLTLDVRIQNIAEQSLRNTPKGAVVVMQAGSGKIRAMASRPQIEPQNVKDYLSSPDAPFVHRALQAYNVGSVFKICVAAAALDAGLPLQTQYTCNGSVQVAGRTFRCHNTAGHGSVDLSTAIAQSCNCYFYQLGLHIGYEGILQTVNRFGFGKSIALGGGLRCSGGSLPTAQNLSTQPGGVANLSIGQGELTLSPVALASLYEAVVCGGTYYLPSLIEGIVQDGVYTPQPKAVQAVGMQPDTAARLKADLIAALNDGIGSGAKPKEGVAGGKTATAQTGKMQNGQELVHGWFCGFVTHGADTYIIVVFAEDAQQGSGACTSVFKEIAEALGRI